MSDAKGIGITCYLELYKRKNKYALGFLKDLPNALLAP